MARAMPDIPRDAGTGVHYGGTAPLPIERGATGAQVPLHNRFHMQLHDLSRST